MYQYPEKFRMCFNCKSKYTKPLGREPSLMRQLWIILIFGGHVQSLFLQTINGVWSCTPVAKPPYTAMLHQFRIQQIDSFQCIWKWGLLSARDILSFTIFTAIFSFLQALLNYFHPRCLPMSIVTKCQKWVSKCFFKSCN